MCGLKSNISLVINGLAAAVTSLTDVWIEMYIAQNLCHLHDSHIPYGCVD